MQRHAASERYFALSSSIVYWSWRVSQQRVSSVDSTPKKAVWALDFDGVVCNSVGESSLTAWKVRRTVSGLFALQ